MSAAPALEFLHVWKSFHRHSEHLLLRGHLGRLFSGQARPEPFIALRDVTFRLEPSESLAVVGSNGAGKSTLLSLVADLVPPSAGAFR